MQIKKIVLILCILLLMPITVFADDLSLDEFSEDVNINNFYEVNNSVSNEPETRAKHIVALDRKTMSVLYEKNAYDVTAMASTTKILTCIVAIENSSLNDIVTVSKKAASIHGSTLGIAENMQISMRDLLYGLMLHSGNDCAIAIAEHISGNVEEFSKLMNKKVEELELKNTHFVTPHGLDDNNHYTTAYELALLTNYALSNKTFKNIVNTKIATISVNGYPRNLSNTNELLGNLNGVYGVKTGFTFNAGRCLVSACDRDNLDVIVVVLGADTKTIRTQDSKNIINYIYNTYELIDTHDLVLDSFENYKKYFDKNIVLEKTTDTPVIKLSELDNYVFPIQKNSFIDLKTKIFTFSKLSTDLPKGTKIGYISVYYKNRILYSLDITLENALNKSTWQYYFKDIIKNYFNF